MFKWLRNIFGSSKLAEIENSIAYKLNVRGICPNCGCDAFNKGPSGGMSLNIRCSGCGTKYWFAPPFTPEIIDNDDRSYNLSKTFILKKFIDGEYV